MPTRIRRLALSVTVLALVALSTPVLPAGGLGPPPAAAATCGPGCALFTDTGAILQRTPSPFPGSVGSHAETSALIWNGQYLLYYRTFVSPAGVTCPIPQGIALATSPDAGAT